jgi:hypothetical protein
VLATRRLPILAGSAFLPGAHHPHCDRHAAHLLRIAGRPLCLGCTCVALGFSLGVLTLCLVRPLPVTGLPAWLAVHVALVGPTALQPWLQWKPYKAMARSLLGFASATWLLGGLTLRHTTLRLPMELALSALVFTVLARALLRLRDRMTRSPCTSCPLGAYPTCSWNLPRILNEADDPALAAALASAIEQGAVVQLPEVPSA